MLIQARNSDTISSVDSKYPVQSDNQNHCRSMEKSNAQNIIAGWKEKRMNPTQDTITDWPHKYVYIESHLSMNGSTVMSNTFAT